MDRPVYEEESLVPIVGARDHEVLRDYDTAFARALFFGPADPQ